MEYGLRRRQKIRLTPRHEYNPPLCLSQGSHYSSSFLSRLLLITLCRRYSPLARHPIRSIIPVTIDIPDSVGMIPTTQPAPTPTHELRAVVTTLLDRRREVYLANIRAEERLRSQLLAGALRTRKTVILVTASGYFYPGLPAVAKFTGAPQGFGRFRGGWLRLFGFPCRFRDLVAAVLFSCWRSGLFLTSAGGKGLDTVEVAWVDVSGLAACASRKAGVETEELIQRACFGRESIAVVAVDGLNEALAGWERG